MDGMAIPTVTENDPVAPLHVLLNTLGSAANNDIAALQEELDDYAEATDGRLDAIEAVTQDSGWIQVTSFQNGFTADQPVYYRKIGPVVYFRGTLLRSSAPTTATVAFNVPTGYRPYHVVYLGGTSNWGQHIEVSGGGDVRIRAEQARPSGSSSGYSLHALSYIAA